MSHRRRRDVCFYAPWVSQHFATELETGGRVPGIGGAETQVLLLSRALAAQGLDVCIIACDIPGVEIPASHDGVEFVKRPMYATGEKLRRARDVMAMRAAVRASDAKVVVVYCSGYWVGLAGVFSKLSRRRFVFASASVGDFEYRIWLKKRRERVLYRLGVALADTIVVATEEQDDLCRRRFGKTPILINSATELADLNELEPQAFLWATRTEANKRPLEYLELARSLPDARFWMLTAQGTGRDDARLWAEVEKTAAELPNVELLPPRPRPELMKLMERAVAVVSTSEYEGLPNIFMEGWSRGVPALAFSHDPDGIISSYGLGGCAEQRRERFTELARELWDARANHSDSAARCRAYVESNHSLQTVGARWADALHLNGASPSASAD